MNKLTVHVLDLASGESAAGMCIDIIKPDGSTITVNTAAGGRCDPYIFAGDDFPIGNYTLTFMVGDYFAQLGYDLPEPRFIDKVVVQAGCGNASYHLPLLVTPWSYSVYRGS